MIKHVIRKRKGFGKCRFLIRQTEQVLVWNDDQRVDNFLQRLDTIVSLAHALAALKLERLGHNTDSQNTKFTCRLRDDRRSTSTRAAAHTCSNKTHVRACEVVNNLFNTFFGRRSTNRGARTRTKTLSNLNAQLDAAFRHGLLQRLSVGVCDNKVDPIKLFLDHVIDRVSACPANAKYCDTWLQIVLSCHREVQCHALSACVCRPIFGPFLLPIAFHPKQPIRCSHAKKRKTHKICEFFSGILPNLAHMRRCRGYQLSRNHFMARLNERP